MLTNIYQVLLKTIQVLLKIIKVSSNFYQGLSKTWQENNLFE
jgi:hypothetical protein